MAIVEQAYEHSHQIIPGVLIAIKEPLKLVECHLVLQGVMPDTPAGITTVSVDVEIPDTRTHG